MSEYKSERENLRIRDYRIESFKSILREEFQLAYFGKINFESVDNMDVRERTMLFNLLLEQKKAEKKAQDDAIKRAKERKRHK